MVSWESQVLRTTRAALTPLRNKSRAPAMAAYMKGIAPFLGIDAGTRRSALCSAWKPLERPTSDDLGSAGTRLFELPEREFHYAAYDLIDRYRSVADEYFLDRYVTDLLVTKPWWDTVDGLVTAAVSPLCKEFDADWLISEWSESSETWLIRAALTHQRGWKQDTNVDQVLELCDRHWGNREFFVAKAIGWAMRDIAKIDAAAIEEFLSSHSPSNTIAIREAVRGVLASQTSERVR